MLVFWLVTSFPSPPRHFEVIQVDGALNKGKDEQVEHPALLLVPDDID